MGHPKLNPLLANVAVVTLLMIAASNSMANAQISSPCASSAMSTFIPCLNYLTGSSATRASPTADCCKSVKEMMTDSVECACLIITGNVPLTIPFSRPLAISLPKICNTGVPLRCQASGVPLPPPGPVIFGAPSPAPIDPSPTAASPIGHRDSKAIAVAPPPTEASPPGQIAPAASPAQVVTLGPVANPGIRPVLNPSSSASNPSCVSCSPLLLLALLLVRLMAFNCI